MMNQELERFAAWREDVHLDLLNAAIKMVVSSTTNADAAKELSRKLSRQPWYVNMDYASFFASAGIRYLGELLERYREKYGMERKNYRAVALALAIALPCVEDNMFIGAQRRNFMKRLQTDAKDDLYLQCALYLLEPASQKERYDSIAGRTYNDPAALVFALWILPEDAFSRFSGQLHKLLFQKRRLSVYGNSGVYAALLKKCGAEIKANRAKSFAPFKALLALVGSYVRPGSKQDVLLQSCGFTRPEIVYLNAALQWESTLSGTLSLNGIPAEKMATEYAELTLNAATEPHEQQMAFLQSLLKKYQRFEVKIEGKRSLWEAVKERLHPCCPQTVAWMKTHIEERFDYAFDVLDPKWDVLPSLVSQEAYHDLFRAQLVREEPNDFTHVLNMLVQYEKLTGTHYSSFFDQYAWEEQDAFNTLVDAGVIKLPDYFRKHQSEQDGGYYKRSSLHYVRAYAKDVLTRLAFEFWQWFFTNYTVRDFPKFFGDSASFDSELVQENHSYHYGGTSSYKMELERAFLTAQEQRQLYEWLDESFFCFHPEKYASFQAYSLSNSVICSLYTLEERRETFSALLAAKPSAVSDSLKRLYYTEAEKKHEAEAEEQRKIQAWQAEIEKAKTEWKNKIEEKYDGTMASAVNIAHYAWRNQRLLAEQLSPLIMERLKKNEYRLSRDELFAFLTLCGFFFKCLFMSWEQTQMIIAKVQEVNADDRSAAAENA